MIEAPTDAIVVLDVPLLVESDTAAERGYEVVIVVEAPEHVRLDRLEGRGLARADATARMKAQATDEQRRAVATHLLDNGADHDALVAQVDALWTDLQARHEEKATRS
jgi:dephospho-CoA kinase